MYNLRPAVITRKFYGWKKIANVFRVTCLVNRDTLFNEEIISFLLCIRGRTLQFQQHIESKKFS